MYTFTGVGAEALYLLSLERAAEGNPRNKQRIEATTEQCTSMSSPRSDGRSSRGWRPAEDFTE